MSLDAFITQLDDLKDKALKVQRASEILDNGFIPTQQMLTQPDRNQRDHRIKLAFLLLADEYSKGNREIEKHSLTYKIQNLIEKLGMKVSEGTIWRDLNYAASEKVGYLYPTPTYRLAENPNLPRMLPLLQCRIDGTTSFYSVNQNFLDSETLKEIEFLTK